MSSWFRLFTPLQKCCQLFQYQHVLRLESFRNLTYSYHLPYRNLSVCYPGSLVLDYITFRRSYSKNNAKNNKLSKLRRDMIKDALKKKQKQLRHDVDMLQDAIQDKKEKLKITEKKIRDKGKLIMKDIKETKEKMEDVIEKENVYTIPNLLCVSRILFSPYLGYLIVTDKFQYALVFMAFAGISDWLDGWIARNYKSQSSKIGSFLDPMADKVLIGTLFLTLTYVDLIPVPLTALIIFRDVVLVVAGFVIRYQSLPPPRTLSKYFDVSYASAQLAPTFISKVNTGIQLTLVASTLAAPVFNYVNHPALQVMWYVTAASTVAAAASYVLTKETFRFLKDERKL